MKDYQEEYYQYVKAHIEEVHTAGKRLGVPMGQLLRHDLSKWSPEEFDPYAKEFYSNENSELFDYAWLHHVHNNPHHWQHWLINDKALDIPDHYIREMIADWLAMSYQSTLNLCDWLSKEYFNMKLTPATWDNVIKILKDNLQIEYLQGTFHAG